MRRSTPRRRTFPFLLLASLALVDFTPRPPGGETLSAAPPRSTPSAARLSETAQWLQAYLRLDTSNPPGNESLGADYLAGLLHREGLETRTFYTPEGRASLYARLEADAPAGGDDAPDPGALLLLHHIDVVPPGTGWTRQPFAGVVADGKLWGRGAIDAKSLGIAQLGALLDLARSGRPRPRDVIFLAVADEESGGERGTAWLLEHHPELFEDVAGVLNEGGANLVRDGEVAWWGVEVAQKRPLWLEITASGRGGHGSAVHPFNANHRLIRALDGLVEMPRPWRVTDPVRRYLRAIAPLHSGPLRELFEDPDRFVRPDGPVGMVLPGVASFFLDSVQVTVLEGSDAINVLPEEARAQVDVRLLPDTDAEAFLAEVREAVGGEVQVEVLLSSPPAPPSPVNHPVYRAVEEVLGEEGPVVPAFIGSFTDSRYLRALGIPTYGIAPFALEGEEMRGVHGPDEAIPLDELEKGRERMGAILRKWLETGPE